MKKNFLIITLVVTNIAFGLFAFAQKVAADEQRELAEQNAAAAQEQTMIAQQMQVIAEENAAVAAEQFAIAEQNRIMALEAEAKCK